MIKLLVPVLVLATLSAQPGDRNSLAPHAPYPTGISWGFFGHQKINYYAVFLLPPEMMVLYKPQIAFLSEHAVDPDKRRYAAPEEAPRHYIDMDHYGTYPFDSLPRKWEAAVARYSEDSLKRHGIVPWWIQTMQRRLTAAFREKNGPAILKISAEIGHYLADAHVPLHTSSNHNGQLTGQRGIHGFWESRLPELFSGKDWDFFIGRCAYIKNPSAFIWSRILESAAAADSVLGFEQELTRRFPAAEKYAFEERNGKLVRQYSTSFSYAYNQMLSGMVERRMCQSIFAVASFWYTAWVDSGQPDLRSMAGKIFSEADEKEFAALNDQWKNAPGKESEHD
jgi:hypothetical protein